MNVLCIGDIVGKPGREALKSLLPDLKKEFDAAVTVVNGENAANGSGLTPRLARQLFESGADILTLGDHTWDQKEIEEYLDQTDHLIRPANFPEGAPGRGWTSFQTASGRNIIVINLLGRTFMRYQVTCPFLAFDAIYKEIQDKGAVVIVDLHAETTSEKVAMGHYVNGRASVLFGTHTHIQTADERILDQGTAYITDVGMSGPYDSVIGQEKGRIVQRFLTSRPIRFKVAQDDIHLSGIVVQLDDQTPRAKQIERIFRKYTPPKEENNSDN